MIRLFLRFVRFTVTLALGALIAVWVMRRLQMLHPDHLARRAAVGAAGLVESARDFVGEVAGEAADREAELRARFEVGRVDDGPGEAWRHARSL
ncbi:hypothetical protein SAMN05421505_1483 [Sinosporangium album]|uniref:Uncharacterized protein n=1 Tax=Sinosporangium album TaxID=504805 RepID=A0A1G8K6J8_9ACTN|nr:hypothetical protein [Sinosporangium album]SDI39075.1 hypothetical protein SAMN05421505_1483 [Sinosporangium album]